MKEQTVKIEFDDNADSVIDHVNKALKKAGIDAKFNYEGTEDDERFIYKLIETTKKST